MHAGNRCVAWLLGLLLPLTALPTALACEGQPGVGPFTVVGWITRPDGTPVVGLPLTLVPLAPGGEPDLENGVYRIEERDSHLVRTNEEGLFVMPQVFDYSEVVTHRYAVMPAWLAGLDVEPSETDKTSLWLKDGLVDLTELEVGMVKAHLAAQPAGAVHISLRDRAGKPYTGTRAVLLGAAGVTLALTLRFENGVAKVESLPVGPASAGLLDGELAYFTQQRAVREQRPLAEYLVSSGVGPPQTTFSVEPGRVAELDLVLP